MPISEQRLTLFALLTEFENDVREIIAEKAAGLDAIRNCIGTESFNKAKSRASLSHSAQGEEVRQLLEFLDLGEELKILVSLRQELPDSVSRLVQEKSKRFPDLIGARNRVMHRRPLEFDDFPLVHSVLDNLCKKASSRFPNTFGVMQLYESGELYKSYRHPVLEEPDALILHNLPQPDFDDTGFLGRKEQVQELKEAISGPYPVITVLGVGGVGKTALTLQVAYDIINDETTQFEAVLWVSAKTSRLTGSDVQEIVSTVKDSQDLAILAVQAFAKIESDDPFKELHEILSSFKVLLIIDNLETILDDRIREFVKQIPAGSKVLFTSRIGLGAFDFTIKLGGLPKKQSISFFKRVASVWGQKHLCNRPDEEIDAYLARLNYAPLGIKWFIQAITKGSSAQRLLSDPKQFLSFCLDNIIDNLSPNARTILNALAVAGKDQSPASLSYICDVDGFVVEEALRELLTSNLIDVVTGKFGDDDRYKIAFLAAGYIGRFKPPASSFQESVRTRQGRLRSATQKAQADTRIGFVYDPTHIQVRKSFADTDAVAAQHLTTALGYSKRRQFAEATGSLEHARNLAPSYYEVYKIEGFIAAKEGNFLLARDSYEQAIALAPDHAPLKVFFAGFLLRHTDEQERAVEILKQASKLDPGSFEIESEMARALMFSQDFQSAWDIIEEVDSNRLRTGRTTRIYYDLRLDMCRRAIEIALDRLDNQMFIDYLSRADEIASGVPKHVFDQHILKKIDDICLHCRSFIHREQGSDASEKARSVRETMLQILGQFHYSSEEIDFSPSSNSEVFYGEVYKIIYEKGFGFLQELNSGGEFFFHKNSFLQRNQFDLVEAGDQLQFKIGMNREGECAIELQAVK